MKTTTPKQEDDLIIVDPKKLLPWTANSRPKRLTKESVRELMQSIAMAGKTRGKKGHIITPLLGRPSPAKPGYYDLAAGHRRRASAIFLKMVGVPLIVREMTDEELQEELITENLQRTDPDPREEAAALKAAAKSGANLGELADRLGKSRAWLSRCIKLLDLSKTVWEEWQQGEISAPLATMELLATLPPEQQQDAVDNPYSLRSRSSLQGYLDRTFQAPLSSLPFPVTSEKWKGTCGTGICEGCPFSTAGQGDLFDDAEEPRCTRMDCFNQRLNLWVADKVEKVEKTGAKVKIVTPYSGLPWLEGMKSREICASDFHSVVKGKKADKGSFHVLNLSQSPYSSYWATSTAPAKSQPTSDLSPAAKEENKKATLTNRRRVIVWKALVEHLEGDHKQPADAELWALLAAFGTSSANLYGEPWKDVERKPDEAKAILWESVQSVIRRRLGDSPAPKDIPNLWEEMELTSNLLGFDLEAAIKTANRDLPPPKSWGTVDIDSLEST